MDWRDLLFLWILQGCEFLLLSMPVGGDLGEIRHGFIIFDVYNGFTMYIFYQTSMLMICMVLLSNRLGILPNKTLCALISLQSEVYGGGVINIQRPAPQDSFHLDVRFLLYVLQAILPANFCQRI